MITADPRKTAKDLRTMVAYRMNPTPHELLMVAALLDVLADANPDYDHGRAGGLRRAFTIIPGGKGAE